MKELFLNRLLAADEIVDGDDAGGCELGQAVVEEHHPDADRHDGLVHDESDCRESREDSELLASADVVAPLEHPFHRHGVVGEERYDERDERRDDWVPSAFLSE